MNILFIVCDTTRADHLGCYGYFRETSPNIDRMAEEGVVFEDFFTSGAPTGPAFTCIYTGLHAIHHRFYQFIHPNQRQIDDRIFTMPEILNALGYTTAAIDNLINFPSHGKHWVRGYDFYINPSPNSFLPPPNLTAEDVNKRLIAWIKHHSNEQFFLFVHYWDPHLPYNQPKRYRGMFHHREGDLSDLKVEEAGAGYEYVPGWGETEEIIKRKNERRSKRFSIDLYDGEIRYMDDAIGEVTSTLKDVGVLDETLIIITADHGERLKLKDWGHGTLYDAVTHVPLIMRHPSILPEGVRVKGLCQQIDLLPTILDLIEAPSEILNLLDIDGRSITPLLRGVKIRDRIFMEQVTTQRAIRTERWKLIYTPPIMGHWRLEHSTPIRKEGVQLYNLKEDPVEIIDLAEEEEKVAEELREELDQWVKENLRGEEDPILEDRSKLSFEAIKYREKIAALTNIISKINLHRGS